MNAISSALANPATGPTILNFVRAAVTRSVVGVAAPPLAIPLLIGGGVLAAQAAWFYWNDQNKKSIQDKAYAKYLPSSPQQGAGTWTGEGITLQGNPSGVSYTATGVLEGGNTRMPNSYPEFYNYPAYPSYIVRLENGSLAKAGEYLLHLHTKLLKPTTWDGLSASQKQEAIESLSDEDWKQTIGEMQQGGTLNDGQLLSSPAMLLDNGREIPSSSRVLSPSQAAIVEGVMDRLKPYQDKVEEMAAILAAAGLVGIGANIAKQSSTIKNIDSNIAKLGDVATQTKNSVDAMQKNMNENFNKIRTRLKGIASFLNFDRILNILIWVQTLHNAFMLSADLSRSLTSMFSTALKALPGNSLLGLPTESEDGSPLDLTTTINKSVENWITRAIGAKNYKLMVLELAQINRIYQSTANISSDMSSIFDSFRNPLAAGIERISVIGNALRRNGVVRDDAYSIMPEKISIRSKGLSRIDRVVEGLETLSNATSSVESVASDVISIQEEVAEIKKYRKEYEDEKTKLTKEIEKKEADTKKASLAPNTTEEDEQRYAPKEL